MNPRPASYKDAALTVELRASESRAGGNRTHSGRLKVCCAAITPRPHEVGRAYAFQSPSACHCFFSFLFGGSVVALGIELSTTRLSAGFGRPALDYHQSRAPRSRTGTLLFPKQACSGTDRRLVDAPLPEKISSVRTAGYEPRAPTLALVAPGPRPGAITRLRYVLIKISQAAPTNLRSVPGIEPISPP